MQIKKFAGRGHEYRLIKKGEKSIFFFSQMEGNQEDKEREKVVPINNQNNCK